MELTVEEARRRLNSKKNLVNLLPQNGRAAISDPPENPPLIAETSTDLSVVPLQQGRSGRPKVPDFLKVKVGTLAHTENQREIAEEFGVSQSVVSKCKTGNVGDSDIQERINENLGLVRDRALDRLMSTLGLIDEAKLLDQDAKGLAHVASSLSRVVKDTTPPEAAGGREGGVQVVVYAPQQKEEKKFEVVDV